VWFIADLLRLTMSNLDPMVEEKLDFFFLWVLTIDCISKVLLMMLETLVSYFDLKLLMCLSAAEPDRLLLWCEM
jgi:hypothetical protein